jgi:hypothetical protein
MEKQLKLFKLLIEFKINVNKISNDRIINEFDSGNKLNSISNHQLKPINVYYDYVNYCQLSHNFYRDKFNDKNKIVLANFHNIFQNNEIDNLKCADYNDEMLFEFLNSLMISF